MPFIGRQPLVGNYIKLDAITTSATTTFNLTAGGVAVYPQTATNCIVSLNGIIQAPTDAYTISGSTIVFASALTTSDVIDFITVLGDVLNIGTPSDGTVGFSKVTSNLITGATAETSIADADTLLIYDDSATALRKMTKSNLFSGIANTPAFLARRGSNQSCANNTTTTIIFDSETFDTNSAYNTSDGKFTVPSGQGGKYLVACNLRFDNNITSGRNAIDIQINGSSTGSTAFEWNVSTYGTVGGTAVLNLSASDYVTIAYYQATGGAVNVRVESIFTAFKLIGV